ncbi:MAG TPA: COX15/CtaA family protein, partial [Lacipirellulaceae bacterium]|nr:COX15/CtaA family protein [Lacipirellulaceae bacterium]
MLASQSPSGYSARTHRWALVLACATFPLLWVGGLVTTTDAGMAVPDWPNTYGYNLFLYPWQTWLLGPWDLFIEHGHRLLASTVGMLTIGLLVLILRNENRRWMKGLGFAALVLVILQGVLGG